MSNSLDDIFSAILVDCFAFFGTDNPVVPDYRIVEDIASEYLTLRPDVLERSSASVQSLSEYNGFAVPPKKVGDVFTVLINKNVLMENLQNARADWIGTIVHETTHVQDFAQYAQIVGATEFDTILRTDLHGMFNLWTEIHARANGYYFVCKYTCGEDGMRDPKRLPDITGRELPVQMNRLLRQSNSTQDGYQQAYLVAQYIGRLYTLQQLYPDDLTDFWVENHFGANTWIAEWFLFFKEHPTLEDAYKHFDEMKVILGQNFTGI